MASTPSPHPLPRAAGPARGDRPPLAAVVTPDRDDHPYGLHCDELGPLPVRDPIALLVIGLFIAAIAVWARALS